MLSMSASPVDQMSGLFTKKTYPVAPSCPVGPTDLQVLPRRGLKKDWRSPPRHERRQRSHLFSGKPLQIEPPRQNAPHRKSVHLCWSPYRSPLSLRGITERRPERTVLA